jgi:hypothetical protein
VFIGVGVAVFWGGIAGFVWVASASAKLADRAEERLSAPSSIEAVRPQTSLRLRHSH